MLTVCRRTGWSTPLRCTAFSTFAGRVPRGFLQHSFPRPAIAQSLLVHTFLLRTYSFKTPIRAISSFILDYFLAGQFIICLDAGLQHVKNGRYIPIYYFFCHCSYIFTSTFNYVYTSANYHLCFFNHFLERLNLTLLPLCHLALPLALPTAFDRTHYLLNLRRHGLHQVWLANNHK